MARVTTEPAVRRREDEDLPAFEEAWQAVYGKGGPYAPPPPRPAAKKRQRPAQS